MNNETRCFPFLLDMTVTITVARTRTEWHSTKFRLGEVTHTVPFRNPTKFRDVSSRIEEVYISRTTKMCVTFIIIRFVKNALFAVPTTSQQQSVCSYVYQLSLAKNTYTVC